MNTIAELNLFDQWLEHNYLAGDAQLMWYRLMALFNKAGWAEWVQVDNLRLMTFIQASSKSTMPKHRDSLVDSRFIAYQKGHKGCPNRYKLLSLVERYGSKNDPNYETNHKPYREPYREPNREHIYKHKPNVNKNEGLARAATEMADWNNLFALRLISPQVMLLPGSDLCYTFHRTRTLP